MKRMLFGLVVFILVALSGCVTYRSFDENENRQLSHDQVFKKASSASNFTIANDSTGWGIRLAYVDTFDAYDVTKYGSFKINYRQLSVVAPLQAIKGQSGDARPVGDKEKLNESETKEWSTETLSQKNAKSEQRIITKGEAIDLSLSSGWKQTFTLDQDGVLPLDDAVCTQLLSAIASLGDLRAIKVESSSLKLSQTLDLSPAPFVHDALSAADDLSRTLASYKVTASDSPQRYDDAQKSLLTLVKPLHYGYQKRLVQAAFDTNFNNVGDALQSQIDSLQASIPTFLVDGQVNDQSDGFVQIWGTATPRPVTAQTLRSQGCQMNPTNIIVNSPDDSNFRGNAFISMTTYFLDKEYGTNAMGGTVPVYRYTTKMPPTFQPIPAQITDLQAKLDALTKAHSDASAQFAPE